MIISCQRVWMRRVVVLVCFIVGACSSNPVSLSSEGARIHLLADHEMHPECVYVQDTKAVTLVGKQSSYQQALNIIKNRTAGLGGTHVSILRTESDDLGTRISAAIYRCPHLK